MRYFGFGLMILASLSVLALQNWFALLAFIPSVWLAFRKSGTQLNTDEGIYREYTSSFGIKRGKWMTIENYPDMALIRGREGFKAYSRGMIELSDSELVYDIYLLTKDHRSKLILKRFKDKESAQLEGRILAEKLGLDWREYSPKVSARTRSRRRR
ncbi:MAG: hypothetical protein HKN45_05755 [Flavobacteriales bacterium]|nr:hypothetical protein [Flavobacteriales bacterium]NNK80978.1 hypothetical protein [Flavobacteriales bacterium]